LDGDSYKNLGFLFFKEVSDKGESPAALLLPDFGVGCAMTIDRPRYQKHPIEFIEACRLHTGGYGSMNIPRCTAMVFIKPDLLVQGSERAFFGS
jgi:hypothetical protein